MNDPHYDQRPFGDAEFADNPENRCPVVLLLDTSISMKGDPLNQLNDGLQVLRKELLEDELTCKRVEIALVTFGPVQVVSDFAGVKSFNPPVLTPTGDTPMGAAVEKGLDLIHVRKESYKANGISYYRPWVFLITDGSPTDNITKASLLVHDGEKRKSFMFFPVGVAGADLATLGRLSTRTPVMLKGLRFAELFRWLSVSLSSVSRSHLGDDVPLTNPTAPDGWATTG